MRMELTVRSPVHIGSGETHSTQDVIFADGGAYVPDVRSYFADHPDEIDLFVSAMERGQPPGLFFDNIERYARYTLDAWASERTVGRSDISVSMKDGRDQPYIPGSSLKGAIRTALAYRALTEGSLELESFDGWAVDQLFRLGRNDPKNDLLKCITVRDTEPVDPNDSLALCEIKTYSRSRSGDMRPKHWSNYAESLRPGTTLNTDIVVDTELLREMVRTYGDRDKAEALLGEEFTSRRILSIIEQALQAFGQAITDEEQRLTDEFEQIESFYDRFGDGPHARLGFGTSYYTNTVATALSAAERISVQVDNRLGRGPLHRECGGSMGRDRHHDEKLFCYRCNTGDVDPNSDEVVAIFPKTRRFVHQEGKPRYPLGWIELTSQSQ